MTPLRGTPRAPYGPQLVAGVLAGLLILRVVAWSLPTGYVWGISFARDVTPALAWPLMLLLSAGVVAALARSGRNGASVIAGGATRAAWPFLLGLGLVTILWTVPDRLHFVGDFVIRFGILESPTGFHKIFPQATPLDELLNHVAPIRFARLVHVEPAVALRGFGLLEAILLVMVSVRFGRRVASTEAAAFLVAVVLSFGGYATLFTGYSKPTPELVLCAIAVGTLGWEWVTRGTGGPWLAIATGFGIAIHRGGLPLLLPYGLALGLAWRRLAEGSGPTRIGRLAVMLIPLLVLATEAPRLVRVIRDFDMGVNFVPPEVRAQGGMWRAAFAPLRLLDDLNAVLLHAPLAPLALLGLATARRPREGLFMAGLLLAFVPVLAFVFLPLGPFRDYDSLGGIGAAAAVGSAWGLARLLGDPPRPPGRGLAMGVCVSVLVPFLLFHFSLGDLDRGFARARALAAGPPARSATQRASLLDWVGVRALNEERYDVAHEAFRELCRETPIPHALQLWGASALIVGDAGDARQAFARIVDQSDREPVGWFGLWMSATLMGDSLEARRAGRRIHEWSPEGEEMRQVVEFFDHYPRLYGIMGGLPGQRRP